MDLILRGANLADGQSEQDIGIEGGRIVAVEPRLEATAGREIDVNGYLVSPPFVDAHFHMDATLSLGLPRLNRSGTLLEGIALWGELKPLLTVDALIDRALAYCDWAVAKGLLAIRAMSISAIHGCWQSKLCLRSSAREALSRSATRCFSSGRLFSVSGAVALLERALDLGVDVVGGIPHFERTMADGAASVRALCEIAARRGLMVDMHCDETDDPMSRHVETLAAETARLGLQGRVTGSHLTSMHSMDNYMSASFSIS